MTEKIILASGSPRRKQLLEWAEIPFEIRVQPTDESFDPDMDSREAAIAVALRKAEAVQAVCEPDRIILAADTMVVAGGQVLGKPRTGQEAIDMLTRLQAHTHQVITGVALLRGSRQLLFADSTEVVFHPLTAAQIRYYVQQYQPYDKAGAYGIQEWIGVVGIRSIHGDFYNVMGLPVSRVVRELAQFHQDPE
ncbi:Maf-like protein [Niabella terrae]